RADGGTAAGLLRAHRGEVAGGGGGRGGGGDVRVRDLAAQPALDLRLRVGVGGDGGQLLARRGLPGGEHEGDLHGLLGDDGDGVRRGEDVERAGDPALDGVLDRRHEGVDGTGEEVRGGGGDGGEGHQLRLRRGELLRGLGESLQEGLVGEGRLGTEESVPHGERVLARTRSLRRRRSGAGE